MKRKISILFLIIFCQLSITNGQTISRKEISSAGGTLANGSNQITYTIGETVIPTLSAGGTTITQGFQQPGEQILTGVLPDTVCAGASISIPLSVIDIGGGNTFTALLSNAVGNFASPITIGTVSGQSITSFQVIIPSNTLPGNGYRIRVVSSSPTINSPLSEVFTTQICVINVNLKVFIQGFYLGAGLMTPVLNNIGVSTNMTECDTIIVELHDALSPNTLVASSTVILHTNGTATALFPYSLNGISLWVSVRSRNAIETWSKLPVLIGNSTLIDFTN